MLPLEDWVVQEKVDRTRHAQTTARFDVEIASVASVVPQHKVSQEVVAETAQRSSRT